VDLAAPFRRLVDAPRQVLAGAKRLDRAPPLVQARVAIAIFLVEVRRAELQMRAAATAYAFVAALVPLVTTTLAFLTAMPALANERARVANMLFGYLLPGAVRGVQGAIEQMSARAAAAGTLSSVVFFVVVLMLFNSIEGTFNRIWKAEQPRTWGQRIALLALFLVVGTVAITTWIYVAREASLLADRYASSPLLSGTRRAGLEVVSLFAAWAFFFVVNKVMPSACVRVRPAIIGAVVAGTIWHASKNAFTWYVANVASYENVYGTLAVVPALFLWIYLTMLLLLLGGTMAFVAQNLATLVEERARETTRGPALAFYAAAVLATLARAFRDEEGPLAREEIARRVGCAPYLVGEACAPLAHGKVVLPVVEGVDVSYALAVPAEHLTLARVVALATGEDLTVPTTCAGGVADRIRAAFDAARTADGDVLRRTTIADLILAPASTRS
jgi:membrane protein